MRLVEFVAGLAPAALVALAGIYVRGRPADEKSARRWLFFLFSILALLFGVQFLIHWWREMYMYRFEMLLLPPMVGTLAALFIHLGTTPKMWSRETVKFTLPIVLVIAALLVGLWRATDPFAAIAISAGSAVTALVWQAWEWRGKRRWLAYLALLLLLLMVGGWILYSNIMLMKMPEWLWLQFIFFTVVTFVWPGLAVALAARLIHASVAGDQPSNWLATVIRLALVVLLLLVIGYQIVTEAVWDRATDGLGSAFLALDAIMVAIAAAMLLAWALTGWRRLAALVFVLLVMLSLAHSNEQGMRMQMSPTEVTKAHAEEINQAIQRYYEREGRYPSTLVALMPFYLWHIPQPMILRDQTWCYEGGDDYYRLGYVHRPGFGAPADYISVRVHAAVGEPPEPSWPCDDELERAKSQAPSGYGNP